MGSHLERGQPDSVCAVPACVVAVVASVADALVFVVARRMEIPAMKPHVGDEADPMSASDGGCTFHGRTMADPRCSNQAVMHLKIRADGLGVVSVAVCLEHEPVGRAAGEVLREHGHEAVCGWPGSIWLDRENRCVLDDSGVRQAAGQRRERVLEAFTAWRRDWPRAGR